MASQTKAKNLDAFDPRALEEHYLAPFRDPSRVHAMCEDYRAGAYADYDIDKKDHEAGKKITIPMLALWGNSVLPPPRQRRSIAGRTGRRM
jgi:haloacetate dehalogenase